MKNNPQTSTKSFEYDKKFFSKHSLYVENFSMIAEMPNSSFYVKDTKFRMVLANTIALQSWGHYDKKPIIGLTNSEMVYGKLAERYDADDMFVISGNKIIDRLELVASLDGKTVIMAKTRKYPLYGKDGKIIGLIGMGERTKDCDNFEQSKLLTYMKDNIDRQINISEFAKLENKSLRTFERNFKQKYNVSPTKYFNYVKVNRICMMLRNTDKNIAEISCDLGFFDQSHMCKTFKNIMGISPKEYRSQL